MMTDRTKQLIIVRGGGDIATGTIHRLHRCGYPVLILETGFPSAIRRCVSFSEAVYDGSSEVEGVTCVKVSSYEEACSIMGQGAVPVMIDEECQVLQKVRPWAVVDAILAKRNLGTSRDMADKTMIIKYVIHNAAVQDGRTATFMPKPIYKEAGNGMHVHMLLLKDGEPVFFDENGYSGLSKTAHYFIGGLLKHVPSLCAFTNPSTNSFKRLVPGFEAPVTIAPVPVEVTV